MTLVSSLHFLWMSIAAGAIQFKFHFPTNDDTETLTPKHVERCDRASGLYQSEVGKVQERKGNIVVLHNVDHGPRRVQAVSKQEEASEVDERLGQSSDLLKGDDNLLPTDSDHV